jgi:hypothetical protein
VISRFVLKNMLPPLMVDFGLIFGRVDFA